MKKAFWALGIGLLVFVTLGGDPALADDPSDLSEVEEKISEAIESYLQDINFQSWDEFLEETGLSADDAEQSIRELLAGNPSEALGRILESGGDLLSGALRESWAVFLQLLVIIVFSAILQRTTGAMDSREAGGGASLALYLCVVCVIGWSFLSLHTLCSQTIDKMMRFFDFIFPVMMTLLAGSGGLMSASGMQPTLLIAVRIISTVISRVILPVILASAVLVLLNHMALEQNLTSVISFLRSLCKWTMGTVMTVLTAVVSIQGVSLAGYDGISIRTAKYTVDTVVPVVGGMLSDLVELMVAGSVIVKNAVGTLGLITLLAIMARPMIEMLVYMLAIRLSAAAAGPLGAGRIGKCLEDFADVALLWLLALLMAAAFVFLLIFIIIAMGNAILMYR